MNIKLGLLATGFVISVTAFVLYFNQQNVQHDLNNSTTVSDTAESIAISKSDQTNTVATKDSSVKSTNPVKATDFNTVTNEASSTSASKSAESPFFQSFSTENDINNAYIRQDDAIYQSTLISSFKTQDFAELIESLNLVSKSSDSLENEQQLGAYLTQQYGSVISNEKYSCAGRICAVMFNYLADTDKEKLKNLHNYGTHYSFYNESVDEYDNPVMKAIFVSTDDPSKLTVAR